MNSLTDAIFIYDSNDGGGGERVLWRAIEALLAANASKTQNKKICCVIYTGDNATGEEILEKAQNRFSIDLRCCISSGELKFVKLSNRIFVEASSWPRFTMIGQSLGSILLGLEALYKYSPHIYVDSMGYAFTFPIFRVFGGSTVACYVHYPTISTDMLQKVIGSEASFNNSADVAKSQILSNVKLRYYQAFAFLYSFVGNRAHLIITNSSWTRGHIAQIWNLPLSRVLLVFPACDTTRLQKLALNGREQLVVSLGQFRPEKNHNLQLDAFLELKRKFPQLNNVKLVMIGGIRVGNEGDKLIVESLKLRISAEPLLRDCASVLVSIHPKLLQLIDTQITYIFS